MRIWVRSSSVVHACDDGTYRIDHRPTTLQDGRIPPAIDAQISCTARLALVVGLAALEKAGVIESTGAWQIPEEERDATGIVFASSFGHHTPMLHAVRAHAQGDASCVRKVALQLLLDANVQLAQIVKARGYNVMLNAACAGVVAAMATACDALRAGSLRRVVVLAADAILQPDSVAIVESFVQLGAATSTSPSAPFAARRQGFVPGEGATALVLEAGGGDGGGDGGGGVCVLSARLANSAYHGTRLDASHVAEQLRRAVEPLGPVAALARRVVYVAHETGTATCFDVELSALVSVFGRDAVRGIPIVAVKGSTGHMMAAGAEDVVAVTTLRTGRLPRTAVAPVRDPRYADLWLVEAPADTDRDVVLRVAAGMGGHIGIVVYMRNKSFNSF